MNRKRQRAQRLAIVAIAVVYLHAACGGGSDSPSAPTGGGTTVGATITLTPNGVSDGTPRVALGARVRFTNNDTRPHEILTTPHLVHTDCPALNDIGILQPGQSKDSGTLNERKGCGFHDHQSPDDLRFRGQVLVGLTEGDPAPPPPSYGR
jgi:plastocyanin